MGDSEEKMDEGDLELLCLGNMDLDEMEHLYRMETGSGSETEKDPEQQEFERSIRLLSEAGTVADTRQQHFEEMLGDRVGQLAKCQEPTPETDQQEERAKRKKNQAQKDAAAKIASTRYAVIASGLGAKYKPAEAEEGRTTLANGLVAGREGRARMKAPEVAYIIVKEVSACLQRNEKGFEAPLLPEKATVAAKTTATVTNILMQLEFGRHYMQAKNSNRLTALTSLQALIDLEEPLCRKCRIPVKPQ
jgi:hypothetical protein